MPLDLSPELMARAMAQPNVSQQALHQALGKPPATGMSKGALATFLGGQAADMGSTLAALQNPALREANPMGAKGTLVTKALMMALMPLVMKKLPRGVANAIGYGGGAVGGAMAARNMAMMGK